jgi:hypothetical protein
MKFTFHNLYVILRHVRSTVIFWTEHSCWCKTTLFTLDPNQICNLLYVVPHTNFPNKILVCNLLDVASHTQIITSKNITYCIWYHKTNPNQIYNLLHVVPHFKFLNQIYNLLDMMSFNQILTKYTIYWIWCHSIKS